MKWFRNCSMHKCWENIYDWSEHSHRDPVANVVIYSAIAFFFGFVSLGLGAALYVILDSPCLMTWDGNDTIESSLARIVDSCHIVIPFCLAIYTICISSIGIAAGEIHQPILYSIFGGTAFCGIFFELYSFCSMITQVVKYDSTLETTEIVLGAIATASHGASLICILIAFRFAWMVNYHFSRQDRMIFAEKERKRQADSGTLDLKIVEINIPEEDLKVSGFQRALANIKGMDAEARKDEKLQAAKKARQTYNLYGN